MHSHFSTILRDTLQQSPYGPWARPYINFLFDFGWALSLWFVFYSAFAGLPFVVLRFVCGSTLCGEPQAALLALPFAALFALLLLDFPWKALTSLIGCSPFANLLPFCPFIAHCLPYSLGLSFVGSLTLLYWLPFCRFYRGLFFVAHECTYLGRNHIASAPFLDLAMLCFN